MPPILALIICVGFILYFFILDKKKSSGLSKAILIPYIWICIAGSRNVGRWLNPGAGADSLDVYVEGSPVDRTVFLLLIIIGIMILVKRRVLWREIFINNIWICLYFLFGLVSIMWSDFPFVALKRWIKGLGTVIMALIILTEMKPYKALADVLRKMAFLLLPLSVVFINYFPHLGRTYHMGRPSFIGVASHKNGLGLLCLVSGIYFFWTLLYRNKEHTELDKKVRTTLFLIMILMIGWLFYKIDSATSLFCMIIAIFVLFFSQLPYFRENPKRVPYVFLSFVMMVIIIEAIFGVKDVIITLLGREPSLTTRVPMWQDLLTMVKNPIFGYGYDSFWMGERQQLIYERWGLSGNAHNGYLEMYLNLGLIGVFFVIAWLISGFKKVVRYLFVDYSAGILRFTILLIAAISSYTEATFYGVSLMWTIFFIAIIDPPSTVMKSLYSEWHLEKLNAN